MAIFGLIWCVGTMFEPSIVLKAVAFFDEPRTYALFDGPDDIFW